MRFCMNMDKIAVGMCFSSVLAAFSLFFLFLDDPAVFVCFAPLFCFEAQVVLVQVPSLRHPTDNSTFKAFYCL
eukprot:m.32246 g.32246  ORF g.32246 m.32246 type:complete len:73 (+) comp31608_c0_seq1:298-516(+)